MEFQVKRGQTGHSPHTQDSSAASNRVAEKASQHSGLLENLLRRIEVWNHLPTEQLADILNVKPESIRSGLCRRGHYLGLIPVKLQNRRLAWPAEDVIRLLNGEEL